MRRNICAYRARGLSFESLEKREMMAGNVSAEVREGHLIVVGDDVANGVEIVGTGRAGEYYVIGQTRAGAPTTIGGAAGRRLVTGVTGRVDVRLGGGHDGIEIHDLTISGDLIVDGLHGSDTVTIGDKLHRTHIGVNLMVNDSSGAGDNRVYIVGATVGNRAYVGFGSPGGVEGRIVEGRNTVLIDGAMKQVVIGAGLAVVNAQHLSISRLYCRTGTLFIGSGRANDTVRLNNVICGSDIVIQTGEGSDDVELRSVNANSVHVFTHRSVEEGCCLDKLSEDEAVAVSNEFGDSDRVRLQDVRVVSDTRVDTGGGWDVVEIFNLGTPQLHVQTGDGLDQVTVVLSHLDELFADLGAGIDSMTLQATSVSGTATLDGGNGWLDSFYDYGGNRIGRLDVRNFELPLELGWPL